MRVLEKHPFLARGLASYLSPGQVVVCGEASSPRDVLIDPWKFKEWRPQQPQCYEKRIYKTTAVKLDTVCVILANAAGGGWKETGRGSGMVTESPSVCQQGGVLPGTGLGHEEDRDVS